MVGLRGFEPPTLCTPCKCASQTALQPEKEATFSRETGRLSNRFSGVPAARRFPAARGEFAQQRRAKRARDDVADAAFFPAAARVLEKSGESETVIDRELFAGGEVAQRADFKAAFPRVPRGFAVFVAGVVDEARRVFRSRIRRVDTEIFVDFEDEDGSARRAGAGASVRLFGGNQFAAVDADERSRGDALRRENALSVHGRSADFDHVFSGEKRCPSEGASGEFREVSQRFRVVALGFGELFFRHAPLPVFLRSSRLVEAGFLAEAENVLHGDDGDFRVRLERGVDHCPVRGLPVAPQVAAEVVARVLAGRGVPADAGVVVVRSRVDDGVRFDVVRQIQVRGVAAESELQHGHAGKPRFGEKLADAVVHVAEVFGDELRVPERLLHGFEEVESRPERPVPGFRRRRIRRDAPVVVKSAEMVEPDDVVKLEVGVQAAQPPAVMRARELVPVVKRVAPKLPVRGEIIRRNAGDGFRESAFVELEDFRILPDVRAVGSDENRRVSDDADAVLEGVFPQRAPLRKKEELRDFEHFDVRAHAGVPVVAARGGKDAGFRRPFVPRLSAEVIFQRAEKRVAGEPVFVLFAEFADVAEFFQRGGIVFRVSAELFQHGEKAFPQRAVVDAFPRELGQRLGPTYDPNSSAATLGRVAADIDQLPAYMQLPALLAALLSGKDYIRQPQQATPTVAQ